MVWTFDLPCLPLLCVSCCGGLTCLCLSRNWWNWISKLRRILKGKIVSACYKKRTLSVTFLFFDFIWILKMTNRIWQNFLASNIHRGINKVAAQKSSSIYLMFQRYFDSGVMNLNFQPWDSKRLLTRPTRNSATSKTSWSRLLNQTCRRLSLKTNHSLILCDVHNIP